MQLTDFGADTGLSLGAWLIHNTALTNDQIANWIGHPLGSATQHTARISPVNQKLLRWPEIRRCEASASAELARPVASFPEPILTAHPPAPALQELNFYSARLGAVNFLTTGRNAWHSTWVRQYQPGAIMGREAPLRQRAESQRTQGSVFYIDQLPALILQSDLLTLIGLEVNRSDQLGRFAAVFDGALTPWRILDAYAYAPANTIVWLHTEGNWLYPAWESGRRLTSASVGADYELAWRSQSPGIPPSDHMRDALSRARRSIRGRLTG